MAGNPDIPEPWASLMKQASAVDNRNDKPSLNGLAKLIRNEAGAASANTLSKIILRKDPTVEKKTRAAIARALANKDTSEDTILDMLDQWVGEEPARPYEAPRHSERLTGVEREAIDNIITVILRAKGITDERQAEDPQKTVADDPVAGQKTDLTRADLDLVARRRSGDKGHPKT